MAAADTTTAPPKAAPQITAHQRRARAEGLDLLGDHDRSQEDRDHVPGHDVRLLRAGRGRGAADAPAAGAGGQHAAVPADVQRAVHDARDDDGLPVRRARLGRVRQLPRAAHDRGARHGVPEAQRPVVLVLPRGRHRLLRVAVLRPRRRWAGRAYTPLVDGRVLPERRRGRVDLPRPPHRHLVAHRRDQLLRDDREHARARHGLGPPAAVRVDDPRLRDPADPGAAGDRGRGDAAAHRPALRDALLRHPGRPVAVAAPVLVLRAPRGLHHGPAGLRGDLRGPARLRPQADLRLQGDRGGDRGHRVPRPARVGAPHVHHAEPDRRADLLHDQLLPHRDPDGREDLQLARRRCGEGRSSSARRCCSRRASSRSSSSAASPA